MSRRTLAGLGPLVLAATGTMAHAVPVPDYAPVSVVMVHEQLNDVAPAFVKDLRDVLGKRLVIERYDPGETIDGQRQDDTSLMWLRDYHPLYRRHSDGALSALRYASTNPNRGAYQAQLSTPLPLVHENGNLVVAGAWVFVGEKILGDNPDHTPDEIIGMLAKALGHPARNVILLPRLPGEATGHVDLFVLPLDDHTVLVPYIEAAAAADRQSQAEANVGERARRFLDTQAGRVARTGLKVIRVPMLSPFIWASPEDGEADTVYFSPANALLANLGERRVAWLPKVDGSALSPTDRLRQRRYLRATQRALHAAGWQARVVDATALGRYLGLFRCVTAPIPRP